MKLVGVPSGILVIIFSSSIVLADQKPNEDPCQIGQEVDCSEEMPGFLAPVLASPMGPSVRQLVTPLMNSYRTQRAYLEAQHFKFRIKAGLQSSSVALRLDAIQNVSQIPGEDFKPLIPLILPLFDDAEVTVRRAVVEELASMQVTDDEFVIAFMRRLSDSDADVRARTIRALEPRLKYTGGWLGEGVLEGLGTKDALIASELSIELLDKLADPLFFKEEDVSKVPLLLTLVSERAKLKRSWKAYDGLSTAERQEMFEKMLTASRWMTDILPDFLNLYLTSFNDDYRSREIYKIAKSTRNLVVTGWKWLRHIDTSVSKSTDDLWKILNSQVALRGVFAIAGELAKLAGDSETQKVSQYISSTFWTSAEVPSKAPTAKELAFFKTLVPQAKGQVEPEDLASAIGYLGRWVKSDVQRRALIKSDLAYLMLRYSEKGDESLTGQEAQKELMLLKATTAEALAQFISDMPELKSQREFLIKLAQI